ncbi:hypothetical protein MNBD_CHLOROFLEXI01-153 [hydrothermal vent metagenome]|uniref:Uncharacterized protein n=1 Tax=hydrothermal vent metagenome TaxID=652676 RepID=A0A3B0UQW2_9ZZZZ
MKFWDFWRLTTVTVTAVSTEHSNVEIKFGQPMFTKKRTVRVKRRRRTNKDGQRPRAQAPSRKRPAPPRRPHPSGGSSAGSGGSSGGGYKPRPSGGSMPSLPGCRGKMS